MSTLTDAEALTSEDMHYVRIGYNIVTHAQYAYKQIHYTSPFVSPVTMLLSRCKSEWRTSLGVSVSVASRHGSGAYFLTGKIGLRRGKTFVTYRMARDVKNATVDVLFVP